MAFSFCTPNVARMGVTAASQIVRLMSALWGRERNPTMPKQTIHRTNSNEVKHTTSVGALVSYPYLRSTQVKRAIFLIKPPPTASIEPVLPEHDLSLLHSTKHKLNSPQGQSKTLSAQPPYILYP